MILPVKESLCPGFECFLEDLFWYSSRINMVQLKVLLPRGSPFQYSFPFIATRILLNIFIPIILIFIVNAMPPWSFDHATPIIRSWHHNHFHHYNHCVGHHGYHLHGNQDPKKLFRRQDSFHSTISAIKYDFVPLTRRFMANAIKNFHFVFWYFP